MPRKLPSLHDAGVVVTGSSGFIGTRLVAALAREGAKVAPFDLCEGSDVRDRAAVLEAARGADVVFHLAGMSSATNFRDPTEADEAWETAVHGMRNVLDSGARRIVFASTATLYGHSDAPVAENHLLPRSTPNPYAAAKLWCEHRCFTQHAPDVRAVRIFAGYGPGDRAKNKDEKRNASPIGQFLDDLANDREPEVYGDGSQVRDFIYVDDIVDALLRAASTQSAHAVFNAATGRGTRFSETLEMMRRLLQLEAPMRVRHSAPPEGYVHTVVGDPALAKRELGFAARTSLEAGLLRTVEVDFPELLAGRQGQATRQEEAG